ncbi:MAG: porin family protein [Chitinophagales bacterium]
MRKGKLLPIILLSFFAYTASAQRDLLNMSEHDNKLYYFGITFGMNYSIYQIKYAQSFANTDTFKKIQPQWQPGFNLGLIGNLRLSKFIDIRFAPALEFSEKRIVFQYSIPNDSASFFSNEAIYMHLPLQFKFKSDRIKNFRFYGLAGGKFDYDLAANAHSRRTNEVLKVSPIDFGFEFGVGFEFYNPNFIFAPEIKLSQGLTNQLYTGDRSLPLTNAIQSLHTRMIIISIHLEG